MGIPFQFGNKFFNPQKSWDALLATWVYAASYRNVGIGRYSMGP